MSRKYRHQGYRDSEHESRGERGKPPPRKPLTPEERAQQRSLRHAVSRDVNEVVRCPNCGRNAQAFGAITPESTCPGCNAPLHCCRACKHFDSGARWECRQTIPERVAEKGKANQCAAYEARLVLDATGKRTGTRSGNDPKSQFDNLFKR